MRTIVETDVRRRREMVDRLVRRCGRRKRYWINSRFDAMPDAISRNHALLLINRINRKYQHGHFKYASGNMGTGNWFIFKKRGMP